MQETILLEVQWRSNSFNFIDEEAVQRILLHGAIYYLPV